ncbi:MAG: PIN domain-containing protein [Acidobacteria bacterium]|nr:PIN domain-containing protein [Acidobacteriota bacterium]
MKPEYFIDTSVWIPYFRESGSEHGDFIDELIDDGRVHINGIVLAELLTGARSSAELDRLASALAGLKLLPSDRASSESAGRSGFALKKKGLSVPLSDIIIATDCIDHGLVLIETDRHYAAIAAHLPLKLYTQPGHVPD